MRQVSTSKVRRYGAVAAIAACVLATLPADGARAADLIGLYAGGAVGQSRVEADAGSLEPFPVESFKANHSAFKLMAGVRPISLIGAEFDYIDFGHPSGSLGAAPADASIKGTAAFGVLYLPVPIIDVFFKAGFARLQSTLSGYAYSACPLASNACPTYAFQLDRTNTSFAAGAGLQIKFGALAVRGEYERFNAAGGNPSLVSIGATWTFL